jgi:UDP-N-acetylglucosamine 2-epimerase (non-hydrolysing)
MKIMIVFGTRPEAIKMCPVVKELEKHPNIEIIVSVTGQHKEMLHQVLDSFGVSPKYDLNIMKKDQSLLYITTEIINKITDILIIEKPDIVLLHGDTSTTFSTALACFYLNIKVGHVEAGLRTNNIKSPFPEEFNRQAVGLIADFHFAPTIQAKMNLIKEGKSESTIYVTGNTAIDALKTTVRNDYSHVLFNWLGNLKLILVTVHRRENFGKPMENIFYAIKKILDEFSTVKVIYPIHKNPKIREIAYKIFGENDNIKIIEPLDVVDFHNFINRSYLIVTDSGGIQEEAPSLGKPVLVVRDTTERPDGIDAGTLKLVGTNSIDIYNSIRDLLNNDVLYKKMSYSSNPYGDGNSSAKIVESIVNNLIH